ncbi:iron-containing redox enzyme family protein [Yinghuangia sp. ASG 101]|uniref:iron-containing redox enzyme family protein n=1 Tax=Yinghuangia sp. ASG 101 TaxID=2896848 RepID=UPI001E5FE097|nr:iron-containing redox enzyme family protein [Yinghuangia sp. ASG 101]UGQ09156.1 iron-containing redox enzyme family protein [Yinghuangia sp. ASG 101]
MTADELPLPRGPVSDAVLAALRTPAGSAPTAVPTTGLDPWGEDLHLALYACHELHYRSFPGVDPGWEWDVGLLETRGRLEARFLDALRAETGGIPGCGGSTGVPPDDVAAALAPLLSAEPTDGTGVSHALAAAPDLARFREYVVHRSVYHLKEADPHALLIPRLTGRAKAAVVAVEFDEYGGGRAERMHATLFADLMRGVGLDATYHAYLDVVPAPMLAVVNLMSTFGWHRGRRGMMVGHFAAAEAGTPPSAARLAKVVAALGVEDPACALFFTEHVEADAVHEQLMRREVIGGLLDEDPGLAADIVFGVHATGRVEARFAAHVVGAWEAGRSSLGAWGRDRGNGL